MDIQRKLLQALQAHLQQKKLTWSEEISQEEWSAFFRLAAMQKILPMVFDAVYLCPALTAHPSLLSGIRQQVRGSVVVQTSRTADFLALYSKLTGEGLKPLVVKGLICRTLYPNPDFRQSGDEDLFLSSYQFSHCCTALEAAGLGALTPEQAQERAHEISYFKPASGLHLEVHRSLFSPDSQAYGGWNQYFSQAFEAPIRQDIQGVPVWTLDHTHHLLYLILHALKHFMHSGFGIRQVCDIILYANAHGAQVDWEELYRCCCECHAHLFTAALFQIGSRYLTLDVHRACIPHLWTSLPVDSQPILDDILSGSIYGAADAVRRHSSTITLNAVVASQRGKAPGPKLICSIFPSATDLAGRYPYLHRRPYLLPLAWAHRILTYRKELAASHGKAATQTIQIGKQRVELLRKYQIIS